MKLKVSRSNTILINVNFVNLLIILCENDFVLMKCILKYLDIKGHCYLVSDDSEKQLYIYIYIHVCLYMLHMYISISISVCLSI